MKQITVTCLVIVLIGSIPGNSAWARGGGGHGGGHYGGGWGHGHGGYYSGFGLGLGLGYGLGYYGAPYYSPYYTYPHPHFYPPAVIAVPATPPIYIQQVPPVTQQYPPGYWYYCSHPEGYYPYVKECPQGWQQVEPTPSAPR